MYTNAPLALPWLSVGASRNLWQTSDIHRCPQWTSQASECTLKPTLTSGSGRPMMVQSILTFDPSIDSLDLSGWVMLGAELAKSPSLGGASLTSSLQEDLVSPMQLVITTVNVPESSGNARLISRVEAFGAFRIWRIKYKFGKIREYLVVSCIAAIAY